MNESKDSKKLTQHLTCGVPECDEPPQLTLVCGVDPVLRVCGRCRDPVEVAQEVSKSMRIPLSEYHYRDRGSDAR